MRELKFRAWNTDTSKMEYGDGLFEFTGVIHELKNIAIPNGTYVTKLGRMFNGKIMQFTGLKDSKGKEIFEGDIITQNWDEENYKYEVFYNQKQARFVASCIEQAYLKNIKDYLSSERSSGDLYKLSNTKGFGLIKFDDDATEYYIIGNIYETPGPLNDHP